MNKKWILMGILVFGLLFGKPVITLVQSKVTSLTNDKNTVRIECITALKQLCDENIEQCRIDCCDYHGKDPKTCVLTMDEINEWIDYMIDECMAESENS